MAEGLILEFEGVGRAEYEAVNALLGIDMAAGTGAWPPGLLAHSAGVSDSGRFVVTEVWASRADQEAFMEERLGGALSEGGISSAPTVTWTSLIAHHTPGT
jgi:hypothetical protein